jgi:hypothetical protein
MSCCYCLMRQRRRTMSCCLRRRCSNHWTTNYRSRRRCHCCSMSCCWMMKCRRRADRPNHRRRSASLRSAAGAREHRTSQSCYLGAWTSYRCTESRMGRYRITDELLGNRVGYRRLPHSRPQLLSKFGLKFARVPAHGMHAQQNKTILFNTRGLPHGVARAAASGGDVVLWIWDLSSAKITDSEACSAAGRRSGMDCSSARRRRSGCCR